MEKNGCVRGTPDRQLSMLSSLSTEDLIPADHPIRRIRVVVDEVLAGMDAEFEAMYARSGRRSVPPETLLKATVLMAMYSIRSERAFCERLNYDMLFKWFLDLKIDDRAFDATTFTKNRQRLLDHEIADVFFDAVVHQAKLRRYTSSDHFSVDGTLLQAWASNKSFKPNDHEDSEGDGNGFKGRNAEVDFKGQKRSNKTHTSTTDPEAMLFRKSNNTAAELCFMGHLLIEHRSGLIVDAELTQATGVMTPKTSLLRFAGWGSPRMSRRTPVVIGAQRLMGAPPAMPGIGSPSGSANESRNRSVGSRLSVLDARSATSAKNGTGPGSNSKQPPTTSSESVPSTPLRRESLRAGCLPALQANPRPPANPPKQPRASYTDPTSGPEPSRTPIFRTLLADGFGTP
jgi:transposase